MFVNAESYHFGRQMLRSQIDAAPLAEAALHLVGRTPVTSTEHALIPVAENVQAARTSFADIVDDLANERHSGIDASALFAQFQHETLDVASGAQGEVAGHLSAAANAAGEVSRMFELAGTEARPTADDASIMQLWQMRSSLDDALQAVGKQRILGIPG